MEENADLDTEGKEESIGATDLKIIPEATTSIMVEEIIEDMHMVTNIQKSTKEDVNMAMRKIMMNLTTAMDTIMTTVLTIMDLAIMTTDQCTEVTRDTVKKLGSTALVIITIIKTTGDTMDVEEEIEDIIVEDTAIPETYLEMISVFQ